MGGRGCKHQNFHKKPADVKWMTHSNLEGTFVTLMRKIWVPSPGTPPCFFSCLPCACHSAACPTSLHSQTHNLTSQSTWIMQLLLDMLISLRIVRRFAICEFSSSLWQKFPSETGFKKASRCGICEERDNKRSPFFTRDNFASRI